MMSSSSSAGYRCLGAGLALLLLLSTAAARPQAISAAGLSRIGRPAAPAADWQPRTPATAAAHAGHYGWLFPAAPTSTRRDNCAVYMARCTESLQEVARLFRQSVLRVLADNQQVVPEAHQALGGRSILLCGQSGERVYWRIQLCQAWLVQVLVLPVPPPTTKVAPHAHVAVRAGLLAVSTAACRSSCPAACRPSRRHESRRGRRKDGRPCSPPDSADCCACTINYKPP